MSRLMRLYGRKRDGRREDRLSGKNVKGAS
jgi:hypothetical protein